MFSDSQAGADDQAVCGVDAAVIHRFHNQSATNAFLSARRHDRKVDDLNDGVNLKRPYERAR